MLDYEKEEEEERRKKKEDDEIGILQRLVSRLPRDSQVRLRVFL